MPPRILIIAGSDSSGGAGIQADIKTVTALGGYAMTAITALTAQNTTGVSDVTFTDPHMVKDQIDACVSDIGVDAVKLGMLGNAGIVEAVIEALETIDAPIICDPVMVATSGATLLEEDAVALYKEKLIPMSTLITPNLPEAEALVGSTSPEALLALGCKNVLLKGGHSGDETITDRYVGEEGEKAFTHPRIESTSTHGTGCTLASAISTHLAHGKSMLDSIEQSIAYVTAAIEAAPGFGQGHGPLWHSVISDR